MLNVEHITESKVRITSDDSGALMELHTHFSFYVDGYKWMNAYRNKMWDGKIRLYNLQNKTLPFGLLPKTMKFAKERGYKINLCPTIKARPEISKDELLSFLDTIEIRSKGKKIEK